MHSIMWMTGCEWHNAETGEMCGAEIFAGVQILERLMPALLDAGFDIDFENGEIDDPLPPVMRFGKEV